MPKEIGGDCIVSVAGEDDGGGLLLDGTNEELSVRSELLAGDDCCGGGDGGTVVALLWLMRWERSFAATTFKNSSLESVLR
jgi:hypothetical protein